MPVVVAVAMIMVAVFTLAKRRPALTPRAGKPGGNSELAGYGLTFVLGVYGGFFSGGYVSLLTAAFVACFGMTFRESVAVTKVLNLFSSLVATAVFAARGLIDWRLGVILSAASFAGGRRSGRRSEAEQSHQTTFFLVAVVVLAAKAVLYDVH